MTHWKNALYILLLVMPTTIYAQTQKTDSLINLLNNKKLTPYQQLVIYDKICNYMRDFDNYRMEVYAKKGLALAEKEDNNAMISNFFVHFGISNAIKGDYDSGLSYFEKALEFAKKENNELPIATIYMDIAVAYSFQSKHEKALEYYMQALPILEKTGDEKRQADILFNISLTHLSLKNNHRALYYLEKVKTLSDKLNDRELMFNVYHNFSYIYLSEEKYDTALKYALQALDISRSSDFKSGEISSLMLISEIYVTGLKEYDTAEKYANQSLHLAEEFGDFHSLIESKINLANIYLEQKRYKDCDELATIVYEMDTTNIERSMDAAKDIIIANVFLGNKEKAVTFFQQYENFVQKHNADSFNQSLSEMEVKYETEKKDLLIAKIEEEKVLHIWISIIGGILLLSLLVLFIFRHRLAKNKQILAEQQFKQLEQEQQIIADQSVIEGEINERTRLARDLHDGLGGMLSVMKLQLDDTEHQQKLRDTLNKSIEELRRIAHHLMPASLLRNGLRAALEDFCLSIPNAHFDFFGIESPLDNRTSLLLYRCCYELVNNAMKYANATTISVQLFQDNTRISLTVEDNGCGFDTASTSSGTGLENLRARVRASNGSLTLHSSPQKGTEAYIEIAIKKG
jgi:signal transduction histidine kinase